MHVIQNEILFNKQGGHSMTLRWIVTEEFQRLINPIIDEINNVAIVGGSVRDPEMRWLKFLKPNIKFYYFGIELSSIDMIEEGVTETYYDLNHEQNNKIQKYDLIFCAQVLEHVWDLKQALKNLISLAELGKYIWINCPASCRSHGSPEYYSAGYQPHLLINLLKNESVVVLSFGIIGSPRAYYFEHEQRSWPSKNEYYNPLILRLSMRQNLFFTISYSIIRWIWMLPKNILAFAKSPEPNSNIDTAIQTYLLVKNYK